jgi:hypothetical protein
MAAAAQPTLESAHAGRNPVVVARMPAGVEMRPVASLVAYERNPRTHSAEQVAQIAASIVEFGGTNPVLITGSGQIIAGHGRVQAAQHLGLSQVPVLVLDHLTPAHRSPQRKAIPTQDLTSSSRSTSCGPSSVRNVLARIGA